MSSPLFLLGPTGSGKSSRAIELAEQLGDAEIVSADAYQVYRGLPLLTAAPSAEDLSRVPHHLIGCLELTRNNDAATHAQRAMDCIRDIESRGKRAIVTGGSGLYVKFISHGISEAPPSDLELRAQLELQPSDELIARLGAIDPEGLRLTPIQNRRYLVRNLEIVLLSGKPLSHWRSNWIDPATGQEKAPIGKGWVIEWPVEELDARIALRAQAMVEAGVADEVRQQREQLAARGEQFSATAEKTLGLHLVEQLLAGEISEADCVKALALITRQYAKRQRTWLRRESWLEPYPS